MSQDGDDDLCGLETPERAGGLAGGRARCQNVINEQHDLPGKVARTANDKGIANILVAGGRRLNSGLLRRSATSP